MEIKKLTTDHYEEMLELLNHTFATKYGREMDFLNEQPKMWVKDDEHMAHQIGVFEDGKLCAVVGIYPLQVMIGGKEFLFATTGNVATHPDYEGRGYFSRLFDLAMKELEIMGADGARLGGDRVRYGRYGFQPASKQIVFEISEKNRIKGFGDPGQDVEFVEIKREDAELLAYCNELSRKADLYVKRSTNDGYRDVYLALCSKHATPFVAMRCGKRIGYIAAYNAKQFVGKTKFGDIIAEWNTEGTDDAIAMLCAWQRQIGRSITVGIAPTMHEVSRLLQRHSEKITVKVPTMVKFINYAGIANALLKVAAKHDKLPKLEYVLGIKEYGNLLISTMGEPYCALTDKAANITLDKADASMVLFGSLDPALVAEIPVELKSILPLPMTWNTNDYV